VLTVRRNGSAGFCAVAPDVEATPDVLAHLSAGVPIGDRCSTGTFSVGAPAAAGRPARLLP
jgi:hypothetical protein